jgi:hypothetical protein
MPGAEGLTCLPARLAHADWGSAPGKRIVATAELDAGIYRAHAPRRVLEAGGLLERMHLGDGAGASTLLGFDFPVGVPRAYARSACRKLLPNGGEPTPQQQKRAEELRLKFAACMRAHGEPRFSASEPSANAVKPNVHPNSPQFKAASKVCLQYFPGGPKPE